MAAESMETLVVEMAEKNRHRFFGKYRGCVKEIADPDHLGRIRALVPEVLGDQLTRWAFPCLPFSGNGMGQFTIPPKEAGVWIEFEAGDLSRPIWSGCWWSDDEPPEDYNGNRADPKLKIIRSEKGLMVGLDDQNQKIFVSDRNGGNLIEIEVQQGKMTLKTSVKIVVEAPQIELVENASHPLVFGDQLLQYLNQLVQLYQSHTHPGELVLGVIPITPAPPVPPFIPATPSLLSAKVKTG